MPAFKNAHKKVTSKIPRKNAQRRKYSKFATEICFARLYDERISEKDMKQKPTFIFSFICEHFSVNAAFRI
jgi:hypothetical protein